MIRLPPYHDFQPVPNWMKDRRQWLLWRNIDGRKIPIRVDGSPAKSSDPSTWTDFKTASHFAGKLTPAEGGIGFAFAAGGGLFGMDCDGCIAPDGKISDWAVDLVSLVGGYCEYSPSGTGLKVFGEGEIPDGRGRKARPPLAAAVSSKTPAVEIYDRGRYFTVTGYPLGYNETYPGAAATVAGLLDQWKLAGEPARAHRHTVQTDLQPVAVSTDERIRRAAAYAEKCDPSISGAGGHDTAFRVACAVTWGFDLRPEEALPILYRWNARCEPPWSDHELRHKIAEADKKGGDLGAPRGYLLSRDRPRVDFPVIQVEVDHRPEANLDDIRREMFAARVAIEGRRGVFLDRSGTGVGKSFADLELASRYAAKGLKSLFIVPTHQNCAEVRQDARSRGLKAEAFPRRIFDSEQGKPNCWNPEADQAERAGLSVLNSVCMGCELARAGERCKTFGYLSQVDAAKEADVMVATHSRGAKTGVEDLADGRDLVAIHENPVPVLRPTSTFRWREINVGRQLFEKLVSDRGVAIVAAPFEFRDEDPLGFCREGLEWLKVAEAILEDEKTVSDLPTVAPPPSSFFKFLWRAVRILGLADRELGRLGELIEAIHSGGRINLGTGERWEGPDQKTRERWLQHTIENAVPHKLVLIGDATSTAQDLRDLTGQPVEDITPKSSPRLLHPITQAAGLDISRGTAVSTVRRLLRGALCDRREWRKAGVICHSNHVEAAEHVAEETGRVTMVSYFGSGVDRASNEWFVRCDSLILLGTPRPGEIPIREDLIRFGDIEAAAIPDPDWRKVLYQGVTAAGNVVEWNGWGFGDPRWQRAFERFAKASLIQAAGRGRGVTRKGIPVLVLSDENCGFHVVTGLDLRVSDGAGRVAKIIRELCGTGDNLTPVDRVRILDLVRLEGVAEIEDQALAVDQAGSGESVPENTVWRWLREAKAAGLIRDVVGGWISAEAIAGVPEVEGVDPLQVGKVLRTVGGAAEPVSAKHVSEALGLSASRCREILAAMTEAGVLYRRGQRGGYSLGSIA